MSTEFPLKGKLYKACKKYVEFVDSSGGSLAATVENRSEVAILHGFIRHGLVRFDHPSCDEVQVNGPKRGFSLLMAIDGEDVYAVHGLVTIEDSFIGNPHKVLDALAAHNMEKVKKTPEDLESLGTWGRERGKGK